MKSSWKELLHRALLAALLLVTMGPLLALVLVFLSLYGCPLYLLESLLVLGLSGLAAAVLAVLLSQQQWRNWRKRLAAGLLAVTAACGLYCAHGLWRDSLPTVDDRQLLLWQYEPFTQDTKAVSLEAAPTLRLEGTNLPRLDGATALYPVYASFVQAVYPQGEYPLYDDDTADGYGRVTCSGTVDAYERLIQGHADLIFAAAPSQDQLDRAAEAGMELHLTPIGREAFVFFVNSKNPVTGLTVEEIQGIYTGRITNWSQVGGKHQSIRPFQRMENSGSQSALLRLMDGLPLIQPEQEDRVAGMDGIIRQVASYRNYSNAIGFSFRFYAEEMAANDQIRLLALDGVSPTKETIRDGSYPISSPFFAVTAAPVGSPDPRTTDQRLDDFLSWMLSPQGQALVEQSGYVSLQ